jgi:tetratricopeptide (TPR) repeat protein
MRIGLAGIRLPGPLGSRLAVAALACLFCALFAACDVLTPSIAAPFLGGSSPPHPAQSAPATTALESLIEAALDEGRNSDAQALLHSLLKQNQIDPDALLRIGIGFAQKGLYDDAALAFARCGKDHPETFEAHYDLALAEVARRRYVEAFRALGAARARNSRERLALLYLRGKIENSSGQLRQAGTDLAAAFTGDPSNENYALDLGLYDLQHNAYPDAARVFRQARTFHPDSLFAALGLALAQYLSGSMPVFVATCRQLLAAHPDFAPARTLLAFGFYMQGNFRQAEQVTRRGLGSPASHPYLDYLDVAILLKLQSTDYARMLREISVAERQIPGCSLCFIAQSKIDDARGAKARAIQDLESAIKIDPAFSDAWYRLASLYDQTGERRQAAQARIRFTELKAAKSQSETDMLRGAFMRSLAGSEE